MPIYAYLWLQPVLSISDYLRYVINPDSTLAATVWQCITSAALIWIALVTPLQVGHILAGNLFHWYLGISIYVNSFNKFNKYLFFPMETCWNWNDWNMQRSFTKLEAMVDLSYGLLIDVCYCFLFVLWICFTLWSVWVCVGNQRAAPGGSFEDGSWLGLRDKCWPFDCSCVTWSIGRSWSRLMMSSDVFLPSVIAALFWMIMMRRYQMR